MSNNLNILVEAKKEYLFQLSIILCPNIIETFQDMYNESKKISKGKKVLLQYQKLLKEVVNWNNHMIHQHSEKINNTCGWLNDLLAAVFVSHVKILSAVRLNSDNKKISIKMPSNDTFIHACYVNAAKDIYKDPYVFHDVMTDHEREEKLNTRLVQCIETTIKELVPVQQILKAYINQDSNSKDLDVMSEIPDDGEDPDIDELPEPEDVTPEEPDELMEESPAPEEPGVPLGAEPDPEDVTTEETKKIEVTGKNLPAEAEDVLFPDAPDQ